MAYKGKFIPINKDKYKGDYTNIIYRSSWECRVMNYLDTHPQVLWWASEELAIPYKSPVDMKMHKYYVDFIFKVKGTNGPDKVYMWEIKPYAQTLPPKQKRRTKKSITEAATYAVNQEKWKAAEIFCKKHDWHFQLITERELGI